MRLLPPFCLALTLAGCASMPADRQAAQSSESRTERWWSHVETLASDEMEGREAGTEGYRRAAQYVAGRLAQYGLEPAGSEGWYQMVTLEEQAVDLARTSAALVRDGETVPLDVPGDIIVDRGVGPRPDRVEAPLVFVGYGLHLPEAGHDDLAGVDLQGKIAVFIGGGPNSVPATLKSHARADRARLLAARGAVGGIEVTAPGEVEVPWGRIAEMAGGTGMYFADGQLRSVPGSWFAARFNPGETEKLFARSGRSFADIAALAAASRPLPAFPLNQTLRAAVATRRTPVSAANVVGRLPGSDPTLAAEHVVLSAHLDGLGIAEGASGDRIRNGALDNAAGVATLLDVAERFARDGVRPKRSILFLFVTAEEKGLLGSRFFARRPSVPRESIVANLNYDMALPIFPLRSVILLGADESSLGATGQAVSRETGLPLVPDPAPNRNSFIRSDQYSFIEQGIPAVAFKFGFLPGSREAEIERAWRATHYHSPTDDTVSTPIEREDTIRLNDFMAAMALRIANAPDRPHWNPDSFFRRFAEGAN